MDASRYYIALVTVVALPPPLLVWLFIHPLIEKWRKLGPLTTYLAMGAFIALGMCGIWSVRGRLLAVRFGFSTPLTVLASVLLCLAIYIRIRWRQVLRPLTLIGLPEISGKQAPGELLTKGVYSRIRHPRYLEVGLALVAAAFFSNYLAVYALGLAYIPIIHLVVRLEERELRDRFGRAYIEYCSRVPRFIPNTRSPGTDQDCRR